MVNRTTARKLSLLFVWMTMILALLTACGGGAPKVDWELTISGDIATPLTLSYQELVEMPQTELNDVMMEKSTGEDEVTSWSGVLLLDIFEKAGAGDYSLVTAVAGDGYAIEITRDELEGAIVALKDGGEWIAEVTPDKGPIRLVTPKTPGNRWVFQLREIQVQE
jgi:DMSO/TMAO reductase YedYZ molybdopterin-dependent catalytic subunit